MDSFTAVILLGLLTLGHAGPLTSGTPYEEVDLSPVLEGSGEPHVIHDPEPVPMTTPFPATNGINTSTTTEKTTTEKTTTTKEKTTTTTDGATTTTLKTITTTVTTITTNTDGASSTTEQTTSRTTETTTTKDDQTSGGTVTFFGDSDESGSGYWETKEPDMTHQADLDSGILDSVDTAAETGDNDLVNEPETEPGIEASGHNPVHVPAIEASGSDPGAVESDVDAALDAVDKLVQSGLEIATTPFPGEPGTAPFPAEPATTPFPAVPL